MTGPRFSCQDPALGKGALRAIASAVIRHRCTQELGNALRAQVAAGETALHELTGAIRRREAQQAPTTRHEIAAEGWP